MALVVTGAPRVWILLPTYNGVRFVGEQIASIQGQSMEDWRLLVRDDGSTDGVAAIVDRLAAADSRIERLADAPANAGVLANVSALMAEAQRRGARRVMLADQDDVWLPQKVAVSLDRLQQAEAADPDRPVLVHTDLTVVDDQLRVIAPSFLHYQRKRHEPVDPLAALLVTNFVTGVYGPVQRAAPPTRDAGSERDADARLVACGVCGGRRHAVLSSGAHGPLSAAWGEHAAAQGLYSAVESRARELAGCVAPRRCRSCRGDRAGAGAGGATRLAPDASAARNRIRRFVDACGNDTGPVARVRAAADFGIHAQYPLRTALIYVRIFRGVGTTRLR